MKLTPLLVCGIALSLRGAEVAKPTDPVAGHPHADAAGAGPTSGLKQEMIAGVTEKDFLKLGDRPKTVKLLVVATWSADNYGMNFNGYSKGAAVYTIPKGWTVDVAFINPGPVPHSLIVIERTDVKKIQMAAPYFTGAVVPKHLQGMSYEKAAFSFTADESGEYALACGFPTHALNGHWIALEISDDAKEPTLKLGDNAVMKAER